MATRTTGGNFIRAHRGPSGLMLINGGTQTLTAAAALTLALAHPLTHRRTHTWRTNNVAPSGARQARLHETRTNAIELLRTATKERKLRCIIIIAMLFGVALGAPTHSHRQIT